MEVKRISIRLVPNLSSEVKRIAKAKGISVNALIAEMAWKFVEEWGKKK